jgi:hypothetical protein
VGAGDAPHVPDGGGDYGVLPAGLVLQGGQLLAVPPGGADPADRQPRPLRPARPGVQAGQLRGAVAVVDSAVLLRRRLPGLGGQAGDRLLVVLGDAPAGQVAHGATSGVRRLQVPQQVVGRTRVVDPDRDLRREEPGICRRAAVSTAIWSVTVSEPAFPGRRSIDSDSWVLAHQDASGWKPHVFLKVTAVPALFEAARMIVASMSITMQPVSCLPATASRGKPPGCRWSGPRACGRTRARPSRSGAGPPRPVRPVCGAWGRPRPGPRAGRCGGAAVGRPAPGSSHPPRLCLPGRAVPRCDRAGSLSRRRATIGPARRSVPSDPRGGAAARLQRARSVPYRRRPRAAAGPTFYARSPRRCTCSCSRYDVGTRIVAARGTFS